MIESKTLLSGRSKHRYYSIISKDDGFSLNIKNKGKTNPIFFTKIYETAESRMGDLLLFDDLLDISTDIGRFSTNSFAICNYIEMFYRSLFVDNNYYVYLKNILYMRNELDAFITFSVNLDGKDLYLAFRLLDINLYIKTNIKLVSGQLSSINLLLDRLNEYVYYEYDTSIKNDDYQEVV